jgi:hypothetical protein
LVPVLLAVVLMTSEPGVHLPTFHIPDGAVPVRVRHGQRVIVEEATPDCECAVG